MKRYYTLLAILAVLTGCASSGPLTVQEKLHIMHSCSRVGGVWYSAASTPEYEGRCKFPNSTPVTGSHIRN